MKVTVLLADAAQTDTNSGKVHALGMGWTLTSTPTAPMAVIMVITFDRRDEAKGSHSIALTLVDEDYEPVAINAEGEHLTVKADAALGVKDDAPEGAPSIATFAINVGPGIQLTAGRLYRWQASIDDQSPESWAVSFATRPDPTLTWPAMEPRVPN